MHVVGSQLYGGVSSWSMEGRLMNIIRTHSAAVPW